MHSGSVSFRVSPRYSDFEPIGKGSYGVVCKAFDRWRGVPVAIKKISDVTYDSVHSIQVLREIQLHRFLSFHPNVVTLVDLIFEIDEDALYIVMDLKDSDLHRVIASSQELSDCQIRDIMKQIIEAVVYMHTSGVIHRDLKPANILVSRECHVSLSDFGFARSYKKTDSTDINPNCDQTERVVTRWYRAPELMLRPNKSYTSSVDMWSVGCILAELLGRKPLFPGSNFRQQLQLIFDVIGAPNPDEISHIRGAHAKKFLHSVKDLKAKSLHSMFPDADPLAIDLLGKLLAFDPARRLSAEEALKHDYFSGCESGVDTTYLSPELNFESRTNDPISSSSHILERILEEVTSFKYEMECSYKILHAVTGLEHSSLYTSPESSSKLSDNEVEMAHNSSSPHMFKTYCSPTARSSIFTTPVRSELQSSDANSNDCVCTSSTKRISINLKNMNTSEAISELNGVNNPQSPHSRMNNTLLSLLRGGNDVRTVKLAHQRSFSTVSGHDIRGRQSSVPTSLKTMKLKRQPFFRGIRRQTGSTVSVSISSVDYDNIVDGTNSPYIESIAVKASGSGQRKASIMNGLKLPISRFINNKLSGFGRS